MAQSPQQRDALQRQAIDETLVCIILGEQVDSRNLLQETSEVQTRHDVELVVRRMFKNELDDRVKKLVQKELKTSNFEELITAIVSKALARYHEILFTRKSAWQNQLGKK
jgi:SpoVK/Ycf46/Vps4 family AAA+-type ATPase